MQKIKSILREGGVNSQTRKAAEFQHILTHRAVSIEILHQFNKQTMTVDLAHGAKDLVNVRAVTHFAKRLLRTGDHRVNHFGRLSGAELTSYRLATSGWASNGAVEA